MLCFISQITGHASHSSHPQQLAGHSSHTSHGHLMTSVSHHNFNHDEHDTPHHEPEPRPPSAAQTSPPAALPAHTRSTDAEIYANASKPHVPAPYHRDHEHGPDDDDDDDDVSHSLGPEDHRQYAMDIVENLKLTRSGESRPGAGTPLLLHGSPTNLHKRGYLSVLPAQNEQLQTQRGPAHVPFPATGPPPRWAASVGPNRQPGVSFDRYRVRTWGRVRAGGWIQRAPE